MIKGKNEIVAYLLQLRTTERKYGTHNKVENAIVAWCQNGGNLQYLNQHNGTTTHFLDLDPEGKKQVTKSIRDAVTKILRIPGKTNKGQTAVLRNKAQSTDFSCSHEQNRRPIIKCWKCTRTIVCDNDIPLQELDRTLCDCCTTDATQCTHSRRADATVSAILSSMSMLKPIQWPMEGEAFFPRTSCPRLLSTLRGVLGDCPFFELWANTEIRTLRIVLNERKTDEDLLAKCMGGSFNRGEINLSSSRTIRPPPCGSFGLLVLPRENQQNRVKRGLSPNNHVVFHKVFRNTKALCERISLEKKHILNNTKIKRRGPAAGYTLPCTPGSEPRCLSKATRGERVISPPKKGGVSVSVDYHSMYSGKWATVNVYQEMKGRKLIPSKGRKGRDSVFHELWESEAYRKITIQNMRSKICYYAILEHYGMSPARTDLEDFVGSTVNGAMNDWDIWYQNGVVNRFDYFLVKYALSLESYINHQACTAHCDGSGEETLALYSRPIEGDDDIRQLEEAVDGYLALLNDRVVVRMPANETIMHATLDDTVHAADESRNYHNFTEAQCPTKH